MLRFLPGFLILLCVRPALAQLVLSGNENKIDRSTGEQRVLLDAPSDTITLIDLSQFPPRVRHLEGIRNSVIGPPSNIAITPDGSLALIASSLRIDSTHPERLRPDNVVHVLDLTQNPPRVIDEVAVGLQPSGMSITHDGKMALVANRAAGTISVLGIRGKRVEHVGDVEVCGPDDEVSDVAISPDDRIALTSVTEGGYLRVLRRDGNSFIATDRKLAVYGGPYRCVITPDGQLGLTAGAGQGSPPDVDALTVVDLTIEPIQTIVYIPIGSGPESFEVSPDGRLVAAVLMNGSNLASGVPGRTEEGLVALLARRGKTFEKVQQVPVGRIPEGVAFTADGRHLLVQCHPAREIWIFRVDGEKIIDTHHRIQVPGMPSSIRAAALAR